MTAEQLVACMPRVDAAVWLEPLNAAMLCFDIDTPERAAAFLAQIAHESGECRRLVENLNYSATRLTVVWPRRFPDSLCAARYAHLPERLANYVYANRLGNGDEASGDGWRYRGRGLIQLTGRANYRECGRGLNLPLESNPDLLEQPAYAALAAAWFWESRGCNALADSRAGDDEDADFVRITTLISGGRHGLASRRRYWQTARRVFAHNDIAGRGRAAA